MKREQCSPCRLTHIYKMAEISKRIFFGYTRLKPVYHRNFFLAVFIFLISDFKISERGKYLTVATNTSGKDAVHHVDSSRNSLYKILWSPHSHKIVRFFFREEGLKHIKNTIHIFLTLSYRKSANSNTWSIKWCDISSRFRPEIIIDNTLNYRKKSLRIES